MFSLLYMTCLFVCDFIMRTIVAPSMKLVNANCKCSLLLRASSEFCRLLIISANSLDPDPNRQNLCHNLDPNRLTP